MLGDHQTTAIRWLFGLGFLGISYWCATTGYERIDFVRLLCGVFFLVLGVGFLWKTIFHVATRPMTMMIDAIFFPGGKFAKPLLNLKLPAHYINEGRFDEALSEYRKILKHYPEEVEAYEKAIWLFLEIFDEPREAEKLLQKAHRRCLTLDERVTRLAHGFLRTSPPK